MERAIQIPREFTRIEEELIGIKKELIEIKNILREGLGGGVKTFFPKAIAWDWYSVKLPFNLPYTFNIGEKKLIISGKQLLDEVGTEKGFVHTAVAGCSDPLLGFTLKFVGPRGTLYEKTFTVRDLYYKGFNEYVVGPGNWAVTRFGLATPDENTVVLSASLNLPFQKDFYFVIQNFNPTSNVILRTFDMNLILVWEE
ncbi:MAG: hypothetical protein QXW83_00200 [Nitrososphaerales archaeon]